MPPFSAAVSLLGGFDRAVRRDRTPTRVAITAGVIFIVAGLVKFVFHSWELRQFKSFGLPWPSLMEVLAGVFEVVGGALLIARLLLAPVAVVLSATMLVAIASSGIAEGDVIPSLTLAPALLIAMLYLIACGWRGRRAPSS